MLLFACNQSVPDQESGRRTSSSHICSLLVVVNACSWWRHTAGGHIVLGSPLNALMSERAAQQVGSARLLDSSTHLLLSNDLTPNSGCARDLRSAEIWTSVDCVHHGRQSTKGTHTCFPSTQSGEMVTWNYRQLQKSRFFASSDHYYIITIIT